MNRLNPSVGVFIVQNDKVLLVKRCGPHGTGTWSTPGGLLEFGEALETCANLASFRQPTGSTAPDILHRPKERNHNA